MKKTKLIATDPMGRKIYMGPENKLEKINGIKIMKVLEAVGHPEAFVTDLSTVSDFDIDPKIVSKKLGFKVQEKDCIWEVAKKIKA
jgi:hypothetical protein